MNVINDGHVILFASDEWLGVLDTDHGRLKGSTTLSGKRKASSAVILPIDGTPVCSPGAEPAHKRKLKLFRS
jgi:hypothetical protein